MVLFNSKAELSCKPLTINIKPPGRIADNEGYTRYDVTGGMRRAASCTNVEDHIMPLQTVQDARAYFEALRYPEHLPAFRTEIDFASNEVQIIANAARLYHLGLRLIFQKLMNRSTCPDL